MESPAPTINSYNHYLIEELFSFPTAAPKFVRMLNIFLGGHDVSRKTSQWVMFNECKSVLVRPSATSRAPACPSCALREPLFPGFPPPPRSRGAGPWWQHLSFSLAAAVTTWGPAARASEMGNGRSWLVPTRRRPE